RCVFPLKISAVNGQPSEVQVYVLSLEPLLEKAMLEKKLPLIHSNDLARAASRAKGYQAQMMNHRRQMARLGKLIVIPEDEIDKKAESIAKSPQLDWDEGLNYAKVGQIDLPNSAKLIPRLAGKSWWLTKQTWTFSPSEMNDLIFQPAIPVLSGMLGTAYGYIGIEYLATFQSDAVPALVAALQSPDRAIRLLAARHLDSFRDSNRNPVHDPRLNSAGAVLLKDPDPVVRAAAVHMLFESWDPQCTASLVEAMADEDPEVRGSASGVLAAHQSEVKGYLPRVKALLKDKNPNVRAVAFELLHRMRVPVAAEDLLGVFPASDAFGFVWDAFNDYTELTGKDVPDSQALPLLQNTNPSLRCLGLSILYHNADKQAVEMALPLLMDREPEVRSRAAALLRGLTGQHFTETQAGEWEKWWVANKANFAIQLHL
ncbi:MAG TPA: HEAT repeat domain-containing protein, partial [Candidatus Acidoferrales bacterium]|nr:HEAT repeat domain-containing protein [Candidatus Acidoferrales bacterium]